VRDADLREAVKTISVPVLVIAGSDDPATTAEEGRALNRSEELKLHLRVFSVSRSGGRWPGRPTAAYGPVSTQSTAAPDHG